MRIALLAQCDSAILVCPEVFDHLIAQDIKQRACSVERLTIQTELYNVQFQLKETKSVLETTSSILLITNREKDLLNKTIVLKDDVIRKQDRQILFLKGGIFAVGVAGTATSIYLLFR